MIWIEIRITIPSDKTKLTTDPHASFLLSLLASFKSSFHIARRIEFSIFHDNSSIYPTTDIHQWFSLIQQRIHIESIFISTKL